MWTCIFAIWVQELFTSRAYLGRQQACAFRLEVAITHAAEICHCWLPETSSLWFALFKPCLSNLPPEPLTGLCSEVLEITLFISLSSSDLQCRAFWCRNKAEKIQTAPRQQVSGATKKEIGLAHLKTMGLGFDFWILLWVICVCEHVLSPHLYRMILYTAVVWSRNVWRLRAEGRLLFSSVNFPVVLFGWAWKN